MNRREAIQAGLSILAAHKIEGEVATIAPVNPQAVVITSPHWLSENAKEAMQWQWAKMFEGSQPKSIGVVPLIILDGGMQLQVVDRKGV